MLGLPGSSGVFVGSKRSTGDRRGSQCVLTGAFVGSWSAWGLRGIWSSKGLGQVVKGFRADLWELAGPPDFLGSGCQGASWGPSAVGLWSLIATPPGASVGRSVGRACRGRLRAGWDGVALAIAGQSGMILRQGASQFATGAVGEDRSGQTGRSGASGALGEGDAWV